MLTKNINYVRDEDRRRLIERGFSEFPEDSKDVFYYEKNGREYLIAKGFNRIEFGDHGPYVEFEREHFRVDLFDQFTDRFVPNLNLENLLRNEKLQNIYYLGMYPAKLKSIKIYFQLRGVENIPNAPRRLDGKEYRFNRPEGYANYVPGKYYISANLLKVKKAESSIHVGVRNV